MKWPGGGAGELGDRTIMVKWEAEVPLVGTGVKSLGAPLVEFTGACLASATKVSIALDATVAAEVVEQLKASLKVASVVEALHPVKSV